MKKLSICIVVVMLFITGCSQSSMEDYQAALVKTDNIQKGVTKTDMGIKMEFNTENMSEEVLRQLKSYEEMGMESTTSFDISGENAKVSSLNVLTLGGLGLNFNYFQDGDKSALYVPVLGKYVSMDAKTLETIASDNDILAQAGKIKLSRDTLNMMDELWRNTFEADEVVKGEKSTMETPEGDVRVVKFTVTPDKEKLKGFVKGIGLIVLQDESVQTAIKEADLKDENETIDGQYLLALLDELIEGWTVTEFEVVDFVDVDGYIVESSVNVGLGVENTEPGDMKNFHMKLVTTNYEIEKKQSILFPELNGENSVTIEELQKGLPSTYENLLN